MKRQDEKLLTARVIRVEDTFSSFLGYMPNPDEVLRDTGERITVYREMRTDPRIKSLLKVFKSAVLAYPPVVQQAQAREAVYGFCRERLDQSLFYRLEKRLLSAVEYGFSAVELVWELDSEGYWVPVDTVLRKPERFVFDAEGNLKYRTPTGELVNLYEQPYKWLVYRFDKDAENPYGTSALKSCYWPWKFKKAGAQFWLMAAEKFSVPSILALFDTSEPEDRIRERALRLSELLSTVQSGSGAALANIKDVKLLSSPEKVSEFRTLLEWCDTQIAYGIVYQSLAVQEAEYGTRSQAEVHQDILSSVARSECLELVEAFQRLVDWVVELNFGSEEATPRIQFDFRVQASWDQVVQAMDRAVPVSRAALYERYGIPKPTSEEDAFLKPSGGPLGGIELADTDKKKARIPLL